MEEDEKYDPDQYAECIIIDDDRDDEFEEFPDSEITNYGLIIENETDNHNEWHKENANGEPLTVHFLRSNQI